MAAGVTWLYAQGDGSTTAQTRTASSLAFSAGDRILVTCFAMPAGHGNVYSMAVDDTATTNNPTWSALATCATNTTSSASFCTKLQAFISDTLTSAETFNITIDPQAGSANDYYISLGVARLTSAGTVVRTGTDIGTNFNDSAVTVTPNTPTSGAATSGNLVIMMVAGTTGSGSVTYNTPPTNFATISGSTMTLTGGMHFSAVSSTTTTASSFDWGFSSTGGDYNVASFTAEIPDAGGGGGATSLPPLRRRPTYLITR